jgi:glyceraldehyde 3-phosphate dehydrogenase
LVDASLTKVLDVEGSELVKIASWYDNEMGYTAQMLRTAKKMFEI